MPTGRIGEAKQRDDGKWEVSHADGDTEVLTDKQFHEQYDVDEMPENLSVAPAVADRTVGESFADPGDYIKRYIEEVEAECKAYEDGVKAVRAEIAALKKAKGEDVSLVRLRHAIHELSHGNPLTRTAGPAQVNRDLPEALSAAPAVEDAISSGPGEETNVEVAGRRQFGR